MKREHSKHVAFPDAGPRSPTAIIVINVLILVPMILATIDVSHGVRTNPDLKEPIDIVEDMGVIMIGWGAALDERGAMRHIFGVVTPANEAWLKHVDHICHNVGIGQLVFGLLMRLPRLCPGKLITSRSRQEALLTRARAAVMNADPPAGRAMRTSRDDHGAASGRPGHGECRLLLRCRARLRGRVVPAR